MKEFWCDAGSKIVEILLQEGYKNNFLLTQKINV